MNFDEITEMIKKDLCKYKNEQGFYDIPMEWPFSEDISEMSVQKILSAKDPKRELDNLFYEMLEEYFFSVDFIPSRQEMIVEKYISADISMLIKENGYSLYEFIENCVNFKVDDTSLQNQLIDVDILVDTGDANYDFTRNIFANSRYSNISKINEPKDLPSCSSLIWLCEQQGVSKEELIKYLHGKPTCLISKDNLIQSVIDESQSTCKAMNVLTFCLKMPLSAAIEINGIINYEKKENDFIRPEKRRGKSYISISKDCTVGIYSPWEASGGDFNILLNEDVRLPIKYIYSANVGDAVGTSIKNIYMDIKYKESLVSINKVYDRSLDCMLEDAIGLPNNYNKIQKVDDEKNYIERE